MIPSGAALMLVLIWLPGGVGSTQVQVIGTPALYFDSLAACISAMPAVEAQVQALNGGAKVSTECYDAASDPRG